MNLINSKRENTLYCEFEDIQKLSKQNSQYFGLSVPYNELGNYETNCIPIAHYYDKNGVLQVVFSRDPSHALGIGCTGAGKTTSLVIPKVHILSSLKNKPSFVIIDVKGELHDKLSGHLNKKGYKIKVIDLDEPEFSACWNPLLDIYDKYIEAHELVSKVIEHTDSIDKYPNLAKFAYKGKPKVWYEFLGNAYSDCTNLNKSISHMKEKLIGDVSEEIRDLSYMFIVTQNHDDPHWDDTARDLFAGVIFAMLERAVLKDGANLTRNQFNLRNIVSAILSSRDSDLKQFINSSDKKGEAYRFANKIVNMEAEKTKSCYFGVLSTQLSPFKSYAIQKVTIKNSIDFDKITEEPEAVFIKMDDLKESNYKLAQLMILRLYQQIKNIAKKMPNRTLEKPVHFILDEFGNFPKFNEFGKMISVSRSYNIWYTMVVQSYSQLKMIYGEGVSNVIIENSNMRLFFGTNDYYTMKSFSEACGKISKISENAYLSGNTSEIVNCPIEEYSTVPVSDLSKIETSEVYITCFRMPVLHSHMERYYMVKEFTPLPIVEYRQIDNIEIGSKEYTFNIGSDDFIYSGKKVYPTKYVPSKKIVITENDKMLNYVANLLKQMHPSEVLVDDYIIKTKNILPKYILDFLGKTDIDDLEYEEFNNLMSSTSFYEQLNKEIVFTFLDDIIDILDTDKEDFISDLVVEFGKKMDKLIKDSMRIFPKEFITNLKALVVDFNINRTKYLREYLESN